MCPLVQHKMQLHSAVKLVEMKTKYFPHPNINLSTKSCGVFLFSRYNNLRNCCKRLSKRHFFPQLIHYNIMELLFGAFLQSHVDLFSVIYLCYLKRQCFSSHYHNSLELSFYLIGHWSYNHSCCLSCSALHWFQYSFARVQKHGLIAPAAGLEFTGLSYGGSWKTPIIFHRKVFHLKKCHWKQPFLLPMKNETENRKDWPKQ